MRTNRQKVMSSVSFGPIAVTVTYVFTYIQCLLHFHFAVYSLHPYPLSSTIYLLSISVSVSLFNIMNQLKDITQLHNRFYGLRHGQSLANVAKIISSDPKISTVEHGLSELGKQQVLKSAMSFCSSYEMSDYGGVAIYSSDFTRARETAEIFAAELRKAKIPLIHVPNGIQLETRLRERYFGDFNGKSDKHYHDVWKFDCDDADHTEFNVESVNSVVHRTSRLILDIEKELSLLNGEKPYQVILVAHGDVLQILQTAFLKKESKLHRSLEHLETATVREFILEGTVL
jgi:glucosyl-3-phosphoglycerate phosphatase